MAFLIDAEVESKQSLKSPTQVFNQLNTRLSFKEIKMEILLVLLIGGGVLFYLYRKMMQDGNMDSTASAPHGVPTVPPMPEPQPAPTVVAEVKRELDVNHDGKVDLADVKSVVKKTRARVKKAADLDGDGRVTVKDVKVAASRARKSANVAADKAAKTAKAATKSRAKK
jgi:hypothetical protein